MLFMLNYLFSCFDIQINMSLIKRMTQKDEPTSITPHFDIKERLVTHNTQHTHTHTHTHSLTVVSVVKNCYFIENLAIVSILSISSHQNNRVHSTIPWVWATW